MTKDVYWLNAQLFKNTRKFMNMTNEELVDYIQNNCSDAVHAKIKELRSLLQDICVESGDTSSVFLDKWCSLKSRTQWAPVVVESLEAIIKLIHESQDIVITRNYIKELDTYEKNFSPRTRFSLSSVKKMCVRKASQNPFGEKHTETFIRYAMVPFFSSEKNAAKFKDYLDWLRKPENLLKVSSNEQEKLSYSETEIESLQGPVLEYVNKHGYSLHEGDFSTSMLDLFRQLLMLSNKYSVSQKKEESDKSILEDITTTYWRQIFPNPSLRNVSTLGISMDELNILVALAAYDTLTAYQSYRDRTKNTPLTWTDCICQSGFYVEMLYFLYSRLWHHDSEYLQAIAKEIRDNAFSQYKTFINENANISAHAFIANNCVIENAIVRDNAYLANCEISDGVIIGNGVVLNAKKVKIERNVHIKSDSRVEGNIFVNIINDSL